MINAVAAAQQAMRNNSLEIHVPALGVLRLPAGEELAYLGGIGVLVAVGLLEWPLAVLLGIGHELAVSRHSKMLRSFGEALESA